MISNSPRRLPGIRFETVVPPAPLALPRMDVAALVGFASSGPLGVPVPVEDMARFREVFGDDLPLAWDNRRGRMQTAHLAAAVEAFFRNGGTRCWVVRVAGPAQTHTFPLPGLYAASELSRPAQAHARCPGSWSDGLAAGTLLESEDLSLSAFETPTAGFPYRFEVLSSRFTLEPGDLLRLRFEPGGPLLFALLERVETAEDGAGRQTALQTAEARQVLWFSSPFGLPTGSPSDFRLDESDGLDRYLLWRQQSPPPGLPRAERLRFEVLVWKGEEIGPRLGGLAFGAAHPRFWARLPADSQRFRPAEDPPYAGERRAEREQALRSAEEFEVLFPLAGPETPGDFFIPWEMPLLPLREDAAGPDNSIAPQDRLARDGLEDFAAGLFLDPGLAGMSSSTLLAEAHHQRYLRGRALQGLHSLLPVEEVSLISVPDAVQRGWRRAPRELPDLLGAPLLTATATGSGTGAMLRWTPVAGAQVYRLELSESADFEPAAEIRQVAETEADYEFAWECPLWRYFRVRAERGGETGPWSNTASLRLPEADFDSCGTFFLEAPDLEPVTSLSPPESDQLLLRWGAVAGADAYRLQAAFDPAFLEPETLLTGTELEFEHRVGEARLTYYRVRAERGEESGPWSVTRLSFPGGIQDWTILPETDYAPEQLLTVQGALLRFCAARADLLGILSLPRHYRDEQALDYLASLRARLGSEAPVLGFGALYHPWPDARRGVNDSASPGAIEAAPPGGAICGVAAARARSEGAWLAPANQPLRDVVSLEPVLGVSSRQRLFEGQLNQLILDPRGFLAMGADTLTADVRLRPINVRRLLILLRRLALREGQTYVFEPNTAAFRRRVEHRFVQVLASLYGRGAFRGAIAEEAFRVVTDQSVNPPGSVERGRLIVELHVAPSRPMEFITVRLLQSGPEGLAVEEV